MIRPATNYQHQTWGGAGCASRRSSPAAHNPQQQGHVLPCQLAGRLGVRSFSHSHPASLLPAGGRMHCIGSSLLPVEQGMRPTHYVQVRGSRPVAAHRLPSQQVLQAVADWHHFHHRFLSSAAPSVSPKANDKGLSDEKIFFASGAKASV